VKESTVAIIFSPKTTFPKFSIYNLSTVKPKPTKSEMQSSDINSKKMTEIKYELIVYWSEADEAFIVEVPELAGCMADGQSYAEAVANAEIIIQEWIETAKVLGRVIPTPKGRLMYA
jgi:predicted RNase H-like HicB family nuclease